MNRLALRYLPLILAANAACSLPLQAQETAPWPGRNPRAVPETPFQGNANAPAKCSPHLSKQACAALEQQLCEFSLLKVSHHSSYLEKIPIFGAPEPRPRRTRDGSEEEAKDANELFENSSAARNRRRVEEHRIRQQANKIFARVDGYTRGHLADFQSYEGLLYAIAFSSEEARLPILAFALPNNVIGHQCAREKLLEAAAAYKARRENVMAEIAEMSGTR